MEQLVQRIKSIRQNSRLRDISDALLLALLSQSEYVPDHVNSGVILFERGEAITYWYLLLSGEVELYLPPKITDSNKITDLDSTKIDIRASIRLRTFYAGAIFGELNLSCHSCCARVRHDAEFVRISQAHFLSLYNKYADHLQPFIFVMEDLVSEYSNINFNFSDMKKELPSKNSLKTPTKSHKIQKQHKNKDILLNSTNLIMPLKTPQNSANLFELNNSVALQTRVFESALVLKRTMQIRSPWMIASERSIQHEEGIEIYKNSMIGYQMTKWLMELAREIYSTTEILRQFSNLHLIGIWQALMDFNFVSHVKNEQHFNDKHVYFKWTIEDPIEEFYQNLSSYIQSMVQTPLNLDISPLLPYSAVQLAIEQFCLMGNSITSYFSSTDINPLPTIDDWQNAMFLLSTLGPDSLLRVILSKSPNERSLSELELVYEELLYVKALSHLSTMVKRKLAEVIRFEQHQHAGTVLFHQGEEGDSWYIILHGSVDVSVIGKGMVCTLHEGDDFGKLALVNEAPRAATVALREDNSQFLRVDKHDFNKILRDVEANTVRLKEHPTGQDALVLERILPTTSITNPAMPSTSIGNYGGKNLTNGSNSASDLVSIKKNQCSYSVMAGLPEKMVEYLLETRIDAVVISVEGTTSSPTTNNLISDRFGGFFATSTTTITTTDENAEFSITNLDTFLEDFILTHIIFMPSNVLCNYLKNYYNRKTPRFGIVNTDRISSGYTNGNFSAEFDFEDEITLKNRVISFLVVWQHVLGIHFFLDNVANSFVEEMYCCVLEDSKYIPKMAPILAQIQKLRQLRENAMQILSRHPITILDCGVYTAQAPAPNPVLPIDISNQCIHLSDTTFITMSVCLDKNCAEIAMAARAKIRRQRRHITTSTNLTGSFLENGFLIPNEHSKAETGTSNSVFVEESSPDEMNEDCFLIEVKSNGERVVYSPTEVSVPTMLSLNGRLYVVFKEEIDTLLPLPEQDGPTEFIHHSVLDLLSSQELALQLYLFHMQLFEATNESELIFQVIGRDQFPGRNSSNLDLLLRRFNEIQYWTSTEVLMAQTPTKRLLILQKFIKIAMHSKNHKDLMSLFAITLGLSNVAVSRLSNLWMKLPNKLKRQYADFEAFLDPSRNHRAYRLLVSKMSPPVVPFVPLLLKDLTFMHEGNKTSFAGLINFEKMHMIANVLRIIRNCKSNKILHRDSSIKQNIQGLIRNFRVIDNQRRLMELSYQIEPPASLTNSKILH